MQQSVKGLIKSAIGPRLLNLRFLPKGAPLAYRPGHYYSPICDTKELTRYYREPCPKTVAPIPGINLNAVVQRSLWSTWGQFLAETPFTTEHKDGFRYRFNFQYFGPGDAIVLYCMMRHFKPKRVIEVGSGFSSACALDTSEHYLNGQTAFTFIEPYPDRLNGLLKLQDKDTVTIKQSNLQDVPASLFDELEANDILFVDSTHVLKTGSDVAYVLFDIMSRLNPGVIVHFHDIHYPFEYPKEWVISRNYSWNETYAVRAFLTNNRAFEILFFNDYFARLEPGLIAREAEPMVVNPGSGLWLRATGQT